MTLQLTSTIAVSFTCILEYSLLTTEVFFCAQIPQSVFLTWVNYFNAVIALVFFENLQFVNADRLLLRMINWFFSLNIWYRTSICKDFAIVMLAAVVAVCCLLDFLRSFVLHKKAYKLRKELLTSESRSSK